MQRPAEDAEAVYRIPFPHQGRNAHAMLNGLYSAAAGMIAQQTRMDALANDISNVNTTGYKQIRMGFRAAMRTWGRETTTRLRRVFTPT